MSNYQELMSMYEDVVMASSIQSVLYWDVETGKMPAMGLEHRSKQFSYLTRKSQDFWRSSRVKTLLDELTKEELDDFESRNVFIIRRRHRTYTKIPLQLLEDLSSQSNTTNQVWKKAKEKIDFSIVRRDMEKLFALNRDHARKLAEIKDMNDPFDALIDQRDEGLDSKIIDKYFSEARDFLIPFLKKHRQEPDDDQKHLREIRISREKEVAITKKIADLFEYRYEGPNAHGIIDEVEHPLTIGCGPYDSRVTVNYGKYVRTINAMNHELGHGVHGLLRNKEWSYLPVNHSGGPAIGECTSRYTENKIGKSKSYYTWFYPHLQKLVGSELSSVDMNTFYSMINLVHPGTSRMTADEVSYGLHIIIRFELEKLLFNDQLNISEIPQAWNNKYEEYLGVEVPNDSLGVMQDLHWFNTYWGYFHGYFMGDLLGSHFHHYMQKDLPNWQEDLGNGDLSDVLAWHRDHIYAHSGRYSSLDLVKEMTGDPLNVKYFKDYLTTKYS